MATIVRSNAGAFADPAVEAFKAALDAYEAEHPARRRSTATIPARSVSA